MVLDGFEEELGILFGLQFASKEDDNIIFLIAQFFTPLGSFFFVLAFFAVKKSFIIDGMRGEDQLVFFKSVGQEVFFVLGADEESGVDVFINPGEKDAAEVVVEEGFGS